MKYETTAHVVGGHLKLHNRQAFEAAFLEWADGPVWATFHSAKVFRSEGQNKYWHAAVIKALAKHCSVTPRQMHEALKVRLLPEIVTIPKADGTPLDAITIGGSTSALTRNEASNLIDRALRLMFAVGLESPPLEPEAPTHYIDFDAPRVSKRQQRALCGELVKSTSHHISPSCEVCRNRLHEIEAMKF